MLKSLGGGSGSGSGSGASTQFSDVTGNTTLSASNTAVAVNATGGAVTITLPTAVGDTNLYTIKKTDSSANTVTVVGNGGQTIDASANAIITQQYTSITLKSDNSNWFII